MDATQLFLTPLRKFVGAQHLSREDLDRLQATKLKDVLNTAVEHVPLYRDLYRQHGVDVNTIAGPDDLWRLPAVSKDDYIQAGPARYVDGRLSLAELGSQTTSGSLGSSTT